MFAPRTTIEELPGAGRVELELRERSATCVFLGRNAVGKTKTLEALFQVAWFSYLAALDWRGKATSPGLLVFDRAKGRRVAFETAERQELCDRAC